MQIVVWFIRIVVVLLLVWFAAKNADPVVLRGLIGGELQAPLALVLLAFFGAGLLLGLAAALITIIQQKREIRKLNRALQHQARDAAKPPTGLPSTDGQVAPQALDQRSV